MSTLHAVLLVLLAVVLLGVQAQGHDLPGVPVAAQVAVQDVLGGEVDVAEVAPERRGVLVLPRGCPGTLVSTRIWWGYSITLAVVRHFHEVRRGVGGRAQDRAGLRGLAVPTGPTEP